MGKYHGPYLTVILLAHDVLRNPWNFICVLLSICYVIFIFVEAIYRLRQIAIDIKNEFIKLRASKRPVVKPFRRAS